MKNILSTSMAVFALGLSVNAANVGFVADSAPWGLTGNYDASLNSAFGAGNWDSLSYASGAAALGGGYKFLWVDGGDGQTAGFESFVNSNRAALETFVSSGGRLYINAARWSGTPAFDLGFGVSLDNDIFTPFAQASGPHPIFTAATGTTWSGNAFAHDRLTGGGTTAIIDDGSGNVILAEKDFGSGHVIFGGLTSDFWHSPTAESEELEKNILVYGAGDLEAVPEVQTWASLAGAAMVGAEALRRRKVAKA